MKKWAIVLLLIAGCQRHNQWQCHHISQKESNSTRILYKSPDPTYGIDIEIVKTHGEMTTYLQVHSGSLCDVDGKAEVTLTTPTKTKSFWAHLHEGNQRIRLSESLQTAFISSLAEGNPVTLQLDGYRETVHPHAFEKTLQKLDSPPYKIPIHLPL